MSAPKKKQMHAVDDQPVFLTEARVPSSDPGLAETVDRKAIKGSDKGEKLNGTNGNDKIDGKGGSDTINGNGGNDKLTGGVGNDKLDGGAGDDTISGGAGNDRLTAGTGINTLSGGTGIDTAAFKGKMGDYEAIYDDNGRLTILKSGSQAMLDDTVELIKFGSDIIDRRVASAPVVTSVTAMDGDGIPGATTIDTTLIINGTADPFARIVVYDGGLQIGITAADARGRWSFDHSDTVLSDGPHFFSAAANYGIGTLMAVGQSATFTIGGVVDLTTLSDGQGFIVQGDAAGDFAGYPVSEAGDVNGDGFGDLIVGALADDGGVDAGAAYVIFGTAEGFGTDVAGRRVLDLNALNPSQGFIIQGDTAGDAARSVSSAGDVNGDGFDDLIVGAPAGDDGGADAGEAYVIFGTASGFGSDVSGRRVLDLTTLTLSQGFIIQGDGAGDEAGTSVSSAGDINGDGFDDLVVGARRGDDGGADAGEAYVIFGTATGFGSNVAGRQVIDLTTLNASQGLIIQGDPTFGYTGTTVSSAGDVNGDGIDDLIIGATHDAAPGKAYIVFGTTSGFGANVGGRQVLDLTTLTTSQGIVIQGAQADDSAGIASSAGDINGDGFDDLIVGAAFAGDGSYFGRAGAAYVIFGTDEFSQPVIDVSTLTAAQGFIIQGAPGNLAGRSVSSAGDINGDGFDDLIVGAPYASEGATFAGGAYVIFGAASDFGTDVSGRQVLDVATLTSSQGFYIQGDALGDFAGSSVSSAGDVNNDGFADLIVGSYAGDDGGDNAGEAYILYGGTFGSNTKQINFTGTSAAEILMGNAGGDTLTGNGGPDIYRSGAGNDRIRIGDAGFRLIDAGGGDQDVVVFTGAGFALDARDYSNSQLTGVEGFNLLQGNNTLSLEAKDVFQFSNTGNGLFTAAGSHNNLVVDGDSGDQLHLFNIGAANAAWQTALFNRQLDGTAEGGYTFVNLVENGSGRVLASVAVDQDVTLSL
jgi:hypothetical protein